jgi:ankyrin repeat protein
MKKIFLLCSALIVSAQICVADTNDITSLIQRGLFEEEANHNLEAAMQAYQSAIAEHDKDRKLVATAIFRMGECYRKLGKAAEASAQYERIVKEFSDQAALVKLSRANLGPAAPAALGETTVSTDPVLDVKLATVRAAYQETAKAALTAKLLRQRAEQASKQNAEGARSFFTITKPDQTLIELVRACDTAKAQFEKSKSQFGKDHPEYKLSSDAYANALELVQNRERALLSSLASDENELIQQEASLKNQLEDLSKKAAEKPGVQAIATTPDATRTPEQLTTSEEDEEIRRIKVMIKNSPDLINAPNDSKDLPLCAAASKGQLLVAKYLLDNGAIINAQNPSGDGAIHVATQKGHKAMVELLLAKGASVDDRNRLQMTPLILAVQNNYLNLTEYLLKHNANPNLQDCNGMTPLFYASHSSGHILPTTVPRNKEFAELLLAAKADPNIPATGGETPLFFAVTAFDSNIVQALLDHGANVNVTSVSGNTPLLCAISQYNANSENMVRQLLKAGANPDLPLLKNVTANTDRTPRRRSSASAETMHPLGRAVAYRATNIVNALLEAKANPNAQFEWQPPILNGGFPAINPDCTPLIAATVLGYTDIAESLIAHGANVNLSTQHDGVNCTALEMAFYYERTTNIVLLLNHKASLQNSNRQWPFLHWAVAHDMSDVIEALCVAGADVNELCRDGCTALFYAVSHGNTNATALLLAHKADPNIPVRGGLPPIALLEQTSNLENMSPQTVDTLRDMLIKAGANLNYKRSIAISLGQPNSATFKSLFMQGDYAKNDYTLSDLIYAAYAADIPQFIRTRCNGTDRNGNAFNQARVPFPDFSKIRINRLSLDGKTNFISVDFSAILESGDKSKDPHLVWGDIVEIPQFDHKVTDTWNHLDENVQLQLAKFLVRRVSVQVKGQTTTLTLLPLFAQTPMPESIKNLRTNSEERIATSFCPPEVVQAANVLLASSDTKQIRILRNSNVTFPIDINSKETYSFILRDGDMIMIPEKGPGSMMPSPGSVPPAPGPASVPANRQRRQAVP